MIHVSQPTREVPIGVMAVVLFIGCLVGLAATSAYGAVEAFQGKHRDTDGRNPI